MNSTTKTDADLKKVQRILDIGYMKIMRYCLIFIGGWPSRVLGEKVSKLEHIHKLHLSVLSVICLPSMLLYLKRNIGVIDFLDLGFSYITCSLNLFATCRLVIVFRKIYGDLLVDFIHKIHLFHQKERSEYAMLTNVKFHRLSQFYVIYINVVIFFGVVFYNVTPIYKNIKSGAYSNYKTENVTFEHSVNYMFPFDCTRNVKGYAVVFVYNWYIAYMVSSSILTSDLLMSLMIFHVYGHVLILINNLKKFRRPSFELNVGGIESKMYSKEEMKLVTNDLRNIIVYHKLIKDFIDKMTESFGYILFIYYVFLLAVGSALLLECSPMNGEALGRYGMLTLAIFQQLIQLSVIFELLGISVRIPVTYIILLHLSCSSDKLCDGVYGLPWEYMDTSNRKIVNTILLNSQKPLSIKALGMVQVGVQSMVTVVKTSISYFIMLKTFTGSEN